MELVNEFESRYDEMAKYDMKYPEKVKGCKFLDMASLELREKQMMLTAARDLTFEKIEKALRRVFGSNQSISDSNFDELVPSQPSSSTSIKTEAFMSNRYSKFQKRKTTDSKPYKKNPIDRSGNITKCRNCESVHHYVADFPVPFENKRQKATESHFVSSEKNGPKSCEDSDVQESLISIALLVGGVLLQQSRNCAILDTACTGTVCGQLWWEVFYESIPENLKKMVKYENSETKIMFGNMESQKAIMKITFPARIGSKLCTITSDVVLSELPFFLSKQAMKKAGMKLNLSEDKVIVFGETIPLSCTSSRHFLLQLSDNKVNEVFLARPNGDLDEKSLWKLHIQFGHCSNLNLEKLLKNGKYKCAKENLDEIYTHCETCTTNSKPVIKPITCVPISCSPNEVVAIDLHQLGLVCSSHLHIQSV